MNPFAYTPIPDGPITFDLTGCKDWKELYRRIRQAFGLPTVCGENWDGVWDFLSDAIEYGEERLILVKGADTMPVDLQDYALPLWKIFDDLQEKYPLVRVEYC